MCDVLIADSYPVFSFGLASLLRDEGYKHVRIFSPDEDVVAATKEHDPTLVIVCENRVNGRGSEIFAELRRKNDDRPVILLTEKLNSTKVIAAIKSGINGLVEKDASMESIRECVHEVRHGRRWIDRQHLQSALAEALGSNGIREQFAGLTDREQQVVELVADDLSNVQIADRLGISMGTVKVHLHNVYRKLGLAKRLDLERMLRKNTSEMPEFV